MPRWLTRRWFIGLCLSLGAMGTVVTIHGLANAENAGRTKDSAPLAAEAIGKKLDQVLANQQAILARFDAVMEELRIIKVRSTR